MSTNSLQDGLVGGLRQADPEHERVELVGGALQQVRELVPQQAPVEAGLADSGLDLGQEVGWGGCCRGCMGWGCGAWAWGDEGGDGLQPRLLVLHEAVQEEGVGHTVAGVGGGELHVWEGGTEFGGWAHASTEGDEEHEQQHDGRGDGGGDRRVGLDPGERARRRQDVVVAVGRGGRGRCEGGRGGGVAGRRCAALLGDGVDVASAGRSRRW